MQQTVLVTGANGFVGSHVLEALAQRADVRVIAACREGGQLAGTFAGEVRVGDLRDPGYLKSVVEGVDVLCHAAAWTSMWGQSENSRRLFLEPGLALIKTARAAGVKRFVNTSTTSAAAPKRSAVIGDNLHHPISAPGREPLWSRHCATGSDRPILGDQHNPIPDTVEGISRERRASYLWFSTAPQSALKYFSELFESVTH